MAVSKTAGRVRSGRVRPITICGGDAIITLTQGYAAVIDAAYALASADLHGEFGRTA